MDDRLCAEAQDSINSINKLELVVRDIPGLKSSRCNHGDHCILIQELKGGDKLEEILRIKDEVKKWGYGRVIIKEFNGNLRSLKVCVDIKGILKEFNKDSCLKCKPKEHG
ncbi:MAG: hypothetical protein AMQ22_00057 [Candidatus Methanofastidiosum methylothiophilum]|uniref:Uncharacterized protein n=1 Tax=Candidatus Methanofastidiosum methylothiophilum TaxID=1705564 RepID=A0A150J9V5_9EURY|nr:MAG: hypothetical protein AMQ22_00057 [Candidatus Methanofastidiosum methylthiophilus]